MYVYRFYKDGDVPSGTIIFDLDEQYPEDPESLQENIDLVGTTYIVLEPFASRIDEMTSVGNKAAFSHQISITRDDDEYGIVLMDANDLKMINDKYGHAAGDEYIKGCCKILCDVFECSPVFRIGRDEFAVILKGRDFEHRHELLAKIKDIFAKIREDKEIEPTKRYSGSVGMADSTTCKTTRETIRTADENMYEDKKLYKEKYGSYR